MAMTDPLLAVDAERGPSCAFDSKIDFLNSSTKGTKVRTTLEEKFGVDVNKLSTTLKAFAGGQAGGDSVASLRTTFLREWPTFFMLAFQAVIQVVTIYAAPMNLLGKCFRILPFAGLGLIAFMIKTIVDFFHTQKDQITVDSADKFFQSVRDGKAKLALTMTMWLTSGILTTYLKHHVSGLLLAGVQVADQFQNSKAIQNLMSERQLRQILEKQKKELIKAKELAEANQERLKGEMSQAQITIDKLKDTLRLQRISGSQEAIRKAETELQASIEHANILAEEQRAVDNLQEELRKAEVLRDESQMRFENLQKLNSDETQLLKHELAQAKQHADDLVKELD